ncbi:MAG: two-component system response regulator, partial [Desulfobulbaceae bacterium]|nr:two-component system response regulator [Desulfobulbaceae bacterium]
IPVRKIANEEATGPGQTAVPASLEDAEKMVILKTLDETNGNKSETARRLHITRKTLLSKLRKYGV